MKFKVTSVAIEGSIIVPDDTYSLVFHDTGTLIQMWSSDGIIDEFPADTVEIIQSKDNQL